MNTEREKKYSVIAIERKDGEERIQGGIGKKWEGRGIFRYIP